MSGGGEGCVRWWCDALPLLPSPPIGIMAGLRGRSRDRRSCRRLQQPPQGRGLETQAASASGRSLRA